MGTICHIWPVDRDQNVSSGDAEQTWHPAEGLAEMAGVIEFAVRNYKLGLRAQSRPGRPHRLQGRDGARRTRGPLQARGGLRREVRGGHRQRPGRRRPRRARCPEARRGGQGEDAEAREAGFGGDLRRGVR